MSSKFYIKLGTIVGMTSVIWILILLIFPNTLWIETLMVSQFLIGTGIQMYAIYMTERKTH